MTRARVCLRQHRREMRLDCECSRLPEWQESARVNSVRGTGALHKGGIQTHGLHQTRHLGLTCVLCCTLVCTMGEMASSRSSFIVTVQVERIVQNFEIYERRQASRGGVMEYAGSAEFVRLVCEYGRAISAFGGAWKVDQKPERELTVARNHRLGW